MYSDAAYIKRVVMDCGQCEIVNIWKAMSW